MAISSEDLRQRLLQGLTSAPTPNTIGGAFGDIGNAIATAIRLRRDVPRLQEQEREAEAKATADRIGGEVSIRDALISSGIGGPQASSIASAPEGVRGALLALQPKPAKPPSALELAEFDLKLEEFEEKKAARRAKRDDEPLERVFDPATGITTFERRSKAIGRQAPPKSGLEVVTDPETGQTTVRTNVSAGTAFGKKAANKIEDQIVTLSESRERLNNIAAEFNPDFLTLQTRAGMSFKEMRDKVGLLPADQQAQLADFTRFRQNTIKNLNRTIKEITGAAMNQQEVPRIQGEVPVATDSPAVFETKLRNAMRLAGLAQARLVHLRNQGVPVDSSFGGIDLDEMPSIMDARGEEIEQELLQQGFAPDVAEQQAIEAVRQEFGF